MLNKKWRYESERPRVIVASDGEALAPEQVSEAVQVGHAGEEQGPLEAVLELNLEHALVDQHEQSERDVDGPGGHRPLDAALDVVALLADDAGEEGT